MTDAEKIARTHSDLEGAAAMLQDVFTLLSGARQRISAIDSMHEPLDQTLRETTALSQQIGRYQDECEQFVEAVEAQA